MEKLNINCGVGIWVLHVVLEVRFTYSHTTTSAEHMATAPGTPEESAQSPPPLGVQGDLELELLGLANSLYNLGTTVVNDSTKERQLGKTGPHGDSTTGKQVGARVNDVIVHLAAIEQLSEGLRTMIPMQVLQYVGDIIHLVCSHI